MPRLTPVKWRDLVERLRALGFEGPFAGGKHPYMVRGDLVLTVPNPHRQEIGADLLPGSCGRPVFLARSGIGGSTTRQRGVAV
jgi:predicted RNA binding protein YcfA (HicA-like mRNA interferase family)